jgi:uncharacterized protein
LPDEPGPDPTKEIQSGQKPITESVRLNAAPSAQLRPWGRADRNRLLVFATIAFVLPVPFILALRHSLSGSGSISTLQSELPAKAITAFFVLMATWMVSRMENRPLDDYGAPPRQAFGERFWEGSVWGFAMLSAILLVLCVSGHFQIDSVALTGGSILRYALGWAAAFLAVSLTEEFGFRGYLLFILSGRRSFWPAAVILSVAFGAAHLPNHGENALGILQVVVTGLIFCLTIRRTGTLWFAVGFHAAWDWAETFFYGTPDSGLLGLGRFLNTSVQGPDWLTGGSAGPEGSVIALVVLPLCALLIHLRFPKAIYPDRPV